MEDADVTKTESKVSLTSGLYELDGENDGKAFTQNEYVYAEEEETETSRSCEYAFKCLKVLFPDKYPLSWFIIHLILITTYFIFNCNSPNKDTTHKVLGDEITLGAFVPMLFIFSVNLLLHIIWMLLRCVVMYIFTFSRYVLVNGLLKKICSNTALSFALLNVLDPSLSYVIFAVLQSVLWQILIRRDVNNADILYINMYADNAKNKFLSFKDSSIHWVSYGIYVYVILSLRCMVLSIVTFLFELRFLMSTNDSMTKYLQCYAKLRRFNICWLSYAMTKPDLMNEIQDLYKISSFQLIVSKLYNKVKKSVKRSQDTQLGIFKNSYVSSGHFKKTARALDMPTELTDSLIHNSSNSGLRNWMLAHCVSNKSPTVSLLHQDIILKNEEMIEKVSEQMFDQIYGTTNDYYKADRMDKETMDRNYSVLVNSSPLPEDTEIVRGNTNKNLEQTKQPKIDSKLSAQEDDPKINIDESESSDYQSKDSNSGSSVKEETNGQPVHTLSQIRESISPAAIIHANLAKKNTIAINVDYISRPDFKFEKGYDRNELFIGKERLSLFIPPDSIDETMNWIDISGHGKINCKMLKQALMNVYTHRKKFTRNIKGQQSVFKVIRRLLSTFSWILSTVVLAFMAGVTLEAIVVSGAAFLSALTVSLSYMYTNFIASIIFVAFSNPYNVGDRIRLEDGEPLTVKRIRTYTTEFSSITGKVFILQNSLLSGMKITNESRTTKATLEIRLKMSYNTTDAEMEEFVVRIKKFINARPNDFVKDSAALIAYEFNPGYCYTMGLWLSCVESWGNWRRIYQLHTELLQVIVRVCKECGITYHLPVQPLHFKDSLPIAGHNKPI
ncbi:hypothetical protein BEWA_004960 [Theileria equi strain WA]|uniref:Mechanosensitive ion channel MscS domain-containing protein n=1 Tax=Theileria equi strain WA TaxID=1537102 RepID=L0B0P8_THEEQ|nr:hypothetical protein BEWA_004960 [Theileria equi strain WA]AFZ81088.1 hypothetical protein BEWA_004960 [Theileria equi strain WA]|eukprot:XP_004830754.1 hypothetical protein BEWA_004960 [Theileria equi strain WA]